MALVDSGGGFGAGLGGDGGGGVPRPRVGLASGGGSLWGMDDGVFGDGDVAEGLDGVLLWSCLRGGGFCWGQGAAGCGGRGVLVAGALLALSPLLWLLGVRVVVLVVLLVLVVLWWAVLLLALRFGLWLRFGLGLGNRLEVVEDVVLEMVGGAVPGGVVVAGALGSPAWWSGGLRQAGSRLRLWLWPWACG